MPPRKRKPLGYKDTNAAADAEPDEGDMGSGKAMEIIETLDAQGTE